MAEHVIRRLGHLGDGIADGPVFVSGALPGETVTGVQKGERLTEMKIVTPSPDRASPPCRHFKSCGGCQMQHLADAATAAWKEEIVTSALGAQGLQAEMLSIHVSPPRSRRRATFAARRTKKGAIAGFHGGKSGTIIEIPDCRLLHPDLMQALPVAQTLAEAGASRKTALRLAAALSAGGLDIAVTDGKPLDGPLRLKLAQIAGAHNLARLCWGDETIVAQHPPEQVFDEIRVVPPPGSFLQATAEGEAALRDDVLEIIDGAARVVDLFAGCGTFALPAAKRAQVLAVEGDVAMTTALEQGWRQAARLKRVSTETRDLFRNPLLAEELRGFDAAIIDPPRAGAEAQIAQLAASGVPVIAHVSCNPVTFARDAATLVAQGYNLSRVRIVDQFRWSTHVELVAEFRSNTR